MPCLGNGDRHCCYVRGKRCPNLEEGTVEGRKWACGLRRELGDWDLVMEDPRYIGDQWVAIGLPFDYCKTFPESAPGGCAQCGVKGR